MVRSRNVRVIIGAVRAFTDQAVQRLTLNIVNRLIEDTPKDTGWAAANWVPQIGGPFRGTAGTKEAAIGGNLDESTQQVGIASLLAYRLKQGPISITNNAPYILELNEGSSQKAPAMFIQIAIIGAIRETARIRSR